MKPKNSPPLQTSLSGARELTEEEKRKLSSEWADRTLNELLAYGDANFDRSFDKKLCEAVADKYGPDKEMSNILINRLRVDRSGKPTGRLEKWTEARYKHLLMVYNIMINQDESRKNVLEKLAEMEGLRGSTRINRVVKKITQARKEVDETKFPEAFRPPSLRKRGD